MKEFTQGYAAISDETENENGLWSTTLLLESIENTAVQKHCCAKTQVLLVHVQHVQENSGESSPEFEMQLCLEKDRSLSQ